MFQGSEVQASAYPLSSVEKSPEIHRLNNLRITQVLHNPEIIR